MQCRYIVQLHRGDAGYSTFIQTAAVVFPFLVVLYLLTVCIVLRTHGNPLRSYVCPTVETTQRDARVRALYDRRFPQALFFICGIILTILNVPSLFCVRRCMTFCLSRPPRLDCMTVTAATRYCAHQQDNQCLLNLSLNSTCSLSSPGAFS